MVCIHDLVMRTNTLCFSFSLTPKQSFLSRLCFWSTNTEAYLKARQRVNKTFWLKNFPPWKLQWSVVLSWPVARGRVIFFPKCGNILPSQGLSRRERKAFLPARRSRKGRRTFHSRLLSPRDGRIFPHAGKNITLPRATGQENHSYLCTLCATVKSTHYR